MELRRVLLMFAIVLGLAALASSIARPPESDDPPARTDAETARPGSRADDRAGNSSAAPRPKPAAPVTLRFRAGAERQARKLEQGRPATVLVEVETPSQAEIPSLGLTQPAEPLTPARFDVLVSEPGSHRIVLQPATTDAIPSRIGTLKVVPRR